MSKPAPLPGEVKDLLIYADGYLVAVNKPAGLPVLPDGYRPQAPHLRGLLAQAFGRIWIVHRLDRETSGVLVAALDARAHAFLNAQFERRQARKIYHALVVGEPS